MTTATATPTVARPLTREDVSYLSRADDVYLTVLPDGQDVIRCVKRASRDDRFAEDRTVDIPVQGNGRYGHFVNAWTFPWASLRTGDTVTVTWARDDGTTTLARERGVNLDVAYVDVKHGTRTHRYLAAYSVTTPDTAEARACHVNPKRRGAKA